MACMRIAHAHRIQISYALHAKSKFCAPGLPESRGGPANIAQGYLRTKLLQKHVKTEA